MKSESGFSLVLKQWPASPCNWKYLGQKNSSTFSTQGLAFLSIGCIRGSLFSCSSTYAFILWHSLLQTLPKAQRTQRLSTFTNVTMIKQVLTPTFTAKQLLDLDKTSTSKFHCSRSYIIEVSLKTRSQFLGHLRHKKRKAFKAILLKAIFRKFWDTAPPPSPNLDFRSWS